MKGRISDATYRIRLRYTPRIPYTVYSGPEDAPEIATLLVDPGRHLYTAGWAYPSQYAERQLGRFYQFV